MKRNIFLIVLLVCFSTITYSSNNNTNTKKQITNNIIPEQNQENNTSRINKYIVKKGDCLWDIANKPEIYNNPEQWILLYKTNLDKIKNPNLLYPGQELTIIIKHPCLINWWSFDEKDGETTTDAKGRKSGKLINGTEFTGGKIGNALNLNGIDNRVEISIKDSDITGTFTISTWFKLNTYSSEMSSPIAAKWGSGTFGTAGYGLFCLGANYPMPPGPTEPQGKIAFAVSSTGYDIILTATPIALTLDEWHYLVGVYNGSTLQLYVDGILVAERDFNLAIHITKAPLVIGGYNPYLTGFTDPLKGLVDELALFNCALSVSEIQALFALGNSLRKIEIEKSGNTMLIETKPK